MLVAAPVSAACLLLKVVQSAADKAPGADADAAASDTTWLASERPLDAAPMVTGLWEPWLRVKPDAPGVIDTTPAVAGASRFHELRSLLV